MKKPRIIPAFLNSLTYDERMYLRYTTLGGVILGGFFVWMFAVLIPSFPSFSWQIVGQFIFVGVIIFIHHKTVSYKKLIKLEPKVKQIKDGNK